MKQVSIVKNGVITNQATFQTQDEADQWLASHEGMKTFGQPKQIVQQEIEVSPAVISQDGTEISPAVTELRDVEIAGDYEVEVIDITSQVEQEAINAEALAFLAATDFYIIRELDNGVPCPAEIKAERQAARDRIVK